MIDNDAIKVMETVLARQLKRNIRIIMKYRSKVYSFLGQVRLSFLSKIPGCYSQPATYTLCSWRWWCVIFQTVLWKTLKNFYWLVLSFSLGDKSDTVCQYITDSMLVVSTTNKTDYVTETLLKSGAKGP